MEKISQEIPRFPKEVRFGLSLSRKIRKQQMPSYGIRQIDVHKGEISKDYTYEGDTKGEDVTTQEFEKAWDKGLRYGYVTEDRGRNLPSSGIVDWMFMIDPQDGSRPAQSGFEMACIVITGIRGYKEDSTLADIEFGVLHAIKENIIILAIKGQGVFEISKRGRQRLLPRQNAPQALSGIAYYFETYTMDTELMGKIINPLNTEVLSKGGFKIEAPSASYGAFALLKGKVDLHIDPRKRLIDDYAHLNPLPHGNPKVISPLDIAPGWLAAKELGYSITNAYDGSLDDTPLWSFDEKGNWKQDNQKSWVLAVSDPLQKQALEKLNEGFALLEKPM